MPELSFTLGQHWIDQYMSGIILLHTLLGHEVAVAPKIQPTPKAFVQMLGEIAAGAYDPAKYFKGASPQRPALILEPPSLPEEGQFAAIALNAATETGDFVSVPAGGIVFEDPIWAILAAHAASRKASVALPRAQSNEELWRRVGAAARAVMERKYEPGDFLGPIQGFLPAGSDPRFSVLTVDAAELATLRERGLRSIPISGQATLFELYQPPGNPK
ncbi:MAG: hypothetical protein ACRD7E_27985 [Bryobacteraceae bacterium]